MIDEGRVKEMRERCEGAVPGPWVLEDSGNSVKSYKINGVCYGLSPRRAKTAMFIARAREDIPWLLSELARLQGENERLEAENTDIQESSIRHYARAREAEDALAEMRRERDKAVSHLRAMGYCPSCKHADNYPDFFPCSECREHSNKYEWRGVKEA